MDYLFTWMHNGSTIIPTSSGSTASILNIASIQAENFVEYSCSVSNGIQPDGVDILTPQVAGNQKIK